MCDCKINVRLCAEAKRLRAEMWAAYKRGTGYDEARRAFIEHTDRGFTQNSTPDRARGG